MVVLYEVYKKVKRMKGGVAPEAVAALSQTKVVHIDTQLPLM